MAAVMGRVSVIHSGKKNLRTAGLPPFGPSRCSKIPGHGTRFARKVESCHGPSARFGVKKLISMAKQGVTTQHPNDDPEDFKVQGNVRGFLCSSESAIKISWQIQHEISCNAQKTYSTAYFSIGIIFPVTTTQQDLCHETPSETIP